MQFPIINGLQARSRVNRAQILEKRTVFEAQTAKTQLKQAIDQAYINMNTALEHYHTLAGQVADFIVSYRFMQQKHVLTQA